MNWKKRLKNMINKEDETRIRKKIGQVIFCGFNGYQISENLKNLIDKYFLGNITCFIFY